MKKPRLSPGEISVKQAAEELQLSERTIINYLQAKMLKGTKVNKVWYIDAVSFAAFKQNFKMQVKRMKLGGINSLPKLHLYRQARFIFGQWDLSFLQETSPATINRRSQIERLAELALAEIGAGFYAFHQAKKVAIYEKSRQYVGNMLALLYWWLDQAQEPYTDPALPHARPENPLTEKLWSLINTLENSLLPCYASLLRRLERKAR